MHRFAPACVGACIAALLLVAVPACSTIGPYGHEDVLEETQRKYVRLIRWGEYDAASSFVSADSRDEFLKTIPALQNVRFTSYEVVQTELNDERDEATVFVAYQGYHLNRLVEHAWSERQTWKRGETDEWRVTPDFEGLRSAVRTMEPR